MQRVQHRQEEDRRARDRRRDVAEHVQLRPPRAPAAGTSAAAARRRSRATRASSCACPRARRAVRPRCSMPCVASRRLSIATARCTCERSCSGFDGSPRSNSRSGRDGGSACVRSISWRSSSRRRWRSNCAQALLRHACRGPRAARPGSVSPFRPSVRRMRCTSTPITPEPSPWRPKAAIASRAMSRISPSEPSRIALRDPLAQRVELHPLLAAVGAGLGQAALDRLALDGAEEEAVEDLVEQVLVVLRLRDRRRQRRAEVLLGRPRDRLERRERVEDLGGADRHALLAQLVGELEHARVEALRTALRQRAVEACAALSRLVALRRGHRSASRRRARRPRRGRCGA